jgi:(p)ppGpp synthase/HD superfamily hydrolase
VAPLLRGREHYPLDGSLAHDILEDTDTKYRELVEAFGEEIASLVEAVTGRGGNRKERNADAYEKIRAHGEMAVMLKLADRIANCTHSGASLDMYKKEWEGFRRALYDRNHVMAQPMWTHLEGLMEDA